MYTIIFIVNNRDQLRRLLFGVNNFNRKQQKQIQQHQEKRETRKKKYDGEAYPLGLNNHFGYKTKPKTTVSHLACGLLHVCMYILLSSL